MKDSKGTKNKKNFKLVCECGHAQDVSTLKLHPGSEITDPWYGGLCERCHRNAVFTRRKPGLTPQEKSKGRSENYWDMTPSEQWAEDKRLGILDWDGK